MEGERGGLVSKVFFTKWYIERVNAWSVNFLLVTLWIHFNRIWSFLSI
jgi:hypothetical protein